MNNASWRRPEKLDQLQVMCVAGGYVLTAQEDHLLVARRQENPSVSHPLEQRFSVANYVNFASLQRAIQFWMGQQAEERRS